MNPLCQGWPGGMGTWSVSRSLVHYLSARAMNSGPLSARSVRGAAVPDSARPYPQALTAPEAAEYVAPDDDALIVGSGPLVAPPAVGVHLGDKVVHRLLPAHRTQKFPSMSLPNAASSSSDWPSSCLRRAFCSRSSRNSLAALRLIDP